MRQSLPEGMILLGVQQAFAFACSLAMHVALGRALGPGDYGVFWVVSAALNVLTLVFLSGLPLAVAKFTAEDETGAASLRRRALWIQAAIGVVAAIALHQGAPLVATHLGNPDLAPLLRSAALALPLTGLATVCVQHLNGLGAFARQAGALAIQSFAKALAVTLPLVLGFGILGSVRGLVVASGVFFVVAGALCRRGVAERHFPTSKLIRLGLLLAANGAFVALWGQLDLLMLQALDRGPDAAGLFTAATTITGAAAVFSVPLLAALFPHLSRTTAAASNDLAARALEKAIYYSFVILCPCVVAAQILNRDLIAVFYGERFVDAAIAVGPLALGVLLFALYEIFDTFLRSSGQASRALRLTIVLVALHFGSNWVLIPRYGLLGVAISVVGVCFLAVLGAGAMVARSVRLRIPWTRGTRVAALSGLVFLPLSVWKPPTPLPALLAGAACVVVYFGVIGLLGLIDAEDRGRFAAALRRLVALEPQNPSHGAISAERG